jgi:membrane fusion protein
MLLDDSDAEQVIQAPEDGKVSIALIAQGQTLALGEALFTITQLDQPMVLRLLIPARAAAVVRTDMGVRFVLQAYPQEKFGQFDAQIENVSNAPSMPADPQQASAEGASAYVAVAKLPAPFLAADGQVVSLKPGMVGEALIPVERRTVIEWILAPIWRGLNESVGLSPMTGT